MYELTPNEIAWCRFLAELEIGLIEPYFTEEPDGFYTKRMVLDHPPGCEFIEVTELGDARPKFIASHIEECMIPRTRRVLRYRRV